MLPAYGPTLQPVAGRLVVPPTPCARPVCPLEASGLLSEAASLPTLSPPAASRVARRVKFDWDNKASVHKLASELQRK